MAAPVVKFARNDSAGFEISPFNSQTVTLKLADGFPLTIHRAILVRCAKLGGLLAPFTQKLDLGPFSSTAGHALVEYLYTSRYGLLEWTGPSDQSLDIELHKLKARLEIYALARTFEVGGLEEQVRDDIERETRDLDIFTVIDAVKDAYPTFIGNDTWVPQWIKAVTKKTFENPEGLRRILVLRDFRDDSSVAKFMFRSMLESYVDVLDSMAPPGGACVSADTVAVEADNTPTSDSSFDDIGGNQVQEAVERPGDCGQAGGVPEPPSERQLEPGLEEGPQPDREPGPPPTRLEEDLKSFFSSPMSRRTETMKKAASHEPEELPDQPIIEPEPILELEQAPETLAPEPGLGLSEAKGDELNFNPELGPLQREDGEYTCVAAPEQVFESEQAMASRPKKKKKGKGYRRPNPEPEVDVIKSVGNDEGPRGCPEPSAMEPEDMAEVGRDAWEFWKVPKEKRSPRVSI